MSANAEAKAVENPQVMKDTTVETPRLSNVHQPPPLWGILTVVGIIVFGIWAAVSIAHPIYFPKSKNAPPGLLEFRGKK